MYFEKESLGINYVFTPKHAPIKNKKIKLHYKIKSTDLSPHQVFKTEEEIEIPFNKEQKLITQDGIIKLKISKSQLYFGKKAE